MHLHSRFTRVRALLVLGLAVAVASLPALASAQTPTAAQVEVFKSLPPAEQQQVLEQIGGKRGSTTSTGIAPSAPTSQLKTDVLAPAGLIEAVPRLRAGDVLLLKVSGPLGNGATTDAETAAPTATTAQVTVPTDLRANEEYRRRLLDGNPYTLDRMGRLILEGARPIVLAGLTAGEAAQRLNAEPTLAGFVYGVTLLPVEPELRPFGYDLFSSVPTTFAPASDIPVPSEYVVGPGDTLQVLLIGESGGSYTLTVGRDGTVDFPQIGPIAVAGLRFTAAKSMLEKRVSEQMIGMRANVSMGPLRSIQVFVLGEAERPGSYTVSGLSTITNALFASGGVKPIGSLRNIQLKRDGRLVRRLDLYDLLLNGDTSNDERLLPGDVIFIPPVGPTVAISGEIQRPAIYEVHEGARASDILYLAGGLTPRADPRTATLERVDGRRDLTVLDLDLTSPRGREMPLQTGDRIRIQAIRDSVEGAVALEGQVYRTGSVQFRPGMRLTDLVGSLDEVKPLADLHYVLIRRETGPTRVVSVVSADLAAAFADPRSSANVPLQPRDRVYVFDLDSSRERVVAPILADLQRQSGLSRPVQAVGIGGRIKLPGQYPLEPGMTVSDLLRAGGGLTQSAYSGSAELTRYEVVNGDRRQTELVELDLAQILAGDPSADIALRPFDYLVIKEMPLWRDQETIRLGGEVRFPGEYPIKRGETLRSVIERAGGLTDQAFPEGSVFTRRDLREREQQQLQVLAERLQRELAALSLQQAQESDKSSSSEAMAAGQALLADLKGTQAVGRLVIELDQVMKAASGSGSDVLVRDGDQLLVPRLTQEVTVIGEVQGPTSHLFQAGLNRDGYIARSGGFTQRADERRVFVIRANGEVVGGGGSAWFSSGGANQIRPGDTVVVPINAQQMRPLTMWTSVTQILFNLAVAVAAVNSF
jgi:polysaccharide export outer membrane protein